MNFKTVTPAVLGLVLVLGSIAGASRGNAATNLVQAARRVDIDILPNRKENEIKLAEKDRSIQVVLLGALGFDVGQVEPGSVTFAGAQPLATTPRRLDSNFDQRGDAEYRFQVGKLAVSDTTTTLCLAGTLKDGQLFRGCGEVVVKP